MSNPTPQDALTTGLLMGPGPAGHWDSERVSGPRVLRVADDRWLMWYYGRDPGFDRAINLPTGRVGLATSADGISWQRVSGSATLGAVFEPHPDPQRFDSAHVGVSDVHFRDGLYWMWYFGGSQKIQKIGPYEAKGIDLRPGVAVSRNGVDWLRLEGPHAGALLPLGAPGDFDAVFCGWPQVLCDSDGWKLYFHTFNPVAGFSVGLAQSTDGLHWHKHGQVLGAGTPGAFDEQGVATRQVVRHGDRYWMFYEGVRRDGHRSIGLASSADGISWSRVPGPEADGSVFAHAPSGSGAWDAFAIGTPCIVTMADGSLRMYYIGSNETATHGLADELSLRHQIGLAVCEGADLTRWRRWQR